MNQEIVESLINKSIELAIQKKFIDSLKALDMAININPGNPIIYYNKGIILRESDNKKKAALELNKARLIKPNWIEPILALSEITIDLYKEGNLELDGSPSINEINKILIEFSSKDADARFYYLRGKLKEFKNEKKEAINLYQMALDKNINVIAASIRMAKLHLEYQEWDKAEIILKKGLKIFPNNAIIHSNLSIALLRQNKLKEALSHSEFAIENIEYEQLPSALINLGTIFHELGDRKKAKKFYKKSLKLDKTNANSILNLGVIELQEKKFKKAEDLLRKAIKIDPSNVQVKINLASILLMNDREKEGWNLYESRLSENINLIIRPKINLRLWEGEKAIKGLVLFHEQGLGDTFQFIRYVSILKKLNIHCYLKAPKNLHEIISESNLVIKCVEEEKEIEENISHWLPLMSLPRILNQKLKSKKLISPPYLKVSKDKVQKWRAILGRKTKLRIAINWQGNPEHEFTISRGRSIPFEQIKKLLLMEGIEWISLQKGTGSEYTFSNDTKHVWHKEQKVIDEIWSFRETSAILKNCDCLISSDSGLAHLAGGLNCKVWLLLPWLAEWRWGLDETNTHWYGNHCLYRQKKEGEWDSVISQVKIDLENWSQKNGS